MKNLSYKTLLIIFFFLLIGIVILTRFLSPNQKASATWWNNNWSFRKSITVNNTGEKQSNVYISLTIDTSDASRFQSDCGDIRFTDQDKTLLDYYIVSGCGTKDTSIHINFPSLTNGNNIFYLYYGNPYIQNGFSENDFSTPATNATPSLKSEEKVSLKKIKVPSKLSKEVSDKYTVSKNTFTREVKDNPKDKIEVEVGDIDNSNSFIPKVKLKRWDDEVNLSVSLIDNDTSDPVVSTDKEKIKWTKDKREVNFYEIEPSTEFPKGGYEFEITLKEKPDTNKVEFNLETKGLRFLYQPELTQSEIDRGAKRPENIINSYAVYYENVPKNFIDEKEYKSGKAFHIYRPKIVDANNNWVWGVLNVDETNGLLTVTIPQEFLDNATYPITHAAGLTIGYDSVGGTTTQEWTDWYTGINVTASAGTIGKISFYGGTTVTTHMKGLIFLDSTDELVTNGISDPTTYSTIEWHDFTFSTKPTLSGSTVYRIGGIADGWFLYYYDNDAAYNMKTGLTDYDSPAKPDTINQYGSYKLSIYATYGTTMGNSSIGISSNGYSANWLGGLGVTAPETGTIASFTGYFDNWAGTNIKGVLVDSSLNIVTNGISGSEYTNSVNGEWMTFTFSTPPSVTTGQTYYLMAIGDSGFGYKYGPNSGNTKYDTTNSYSSPQDPTGAASYDVNMSIYATYADNPNPPTLILPTNSATGVTTSPTLTTVTTDLNDDDLQYKIIFGTDAVFSGTTQVFNQTVSNVGWSSQDVGTSAYASGTTAAYVLQVGLSYSTMYYWKSQAIDYSGSDTWSNLSIGYSFTTDAAPPSSPSPPSNCLINESRTDTYLIPKWSDNSSDEDGFQLEKNTDAGGFSFLTNIATGVTAYQDTSVSSDHTYAYRVRSYKTDVGSTLFSSYCIHPTLDLHTGNFNFESINLEGLELN
jgi:uncharacterized protein DUF2341